MDKKSLLRIAVVISLLHPWMIVGAQNLLVYGEAIDGNLEQGTVDQWQFEGTEGDIVSVAMNSSDFDAMLEIMSSSGTTLSSDDNSGKNSNALIRDVRIAETGIYTVLASGAADGAGQYTLIINSVENIEEENLTSDGQCERFENLVFEDYDLSDAPELLQFSLIFDEGEFEEDFEDLGIRYPLGWPPPVHASYGLAGLRSYNRNPRQSDDLNIGFWSTSDNIPPCGVVQEMYERIEGVAQTSLEYGQSDGTVLTLKLGENRTVLTYFQVLVSSTEGSYMGHMQAYIDVEGTLIHMTVEHHPEVLEQWNLTILAIAASLTKDFTVPMLTVGSQAVTYVTDDGLNLRSGPAINNAIIEKMPAGTLVTVIGGPIQADGYVWWQVRSSATSSEGWAVEAADELQTLVPLPNST